MQEESMLGTTLIVILLLALFGVLSRWSHRGSWGNDSTGGAGVFLVMVVILLALGRI
jgi:hypothetical protein